MATDLIAGGHHRRPTFFWQALLIVLPVAVLATLGLFSLRQDRRLAEQDARERAQEVLSQRTTEFSRLVGARLVQFQDWADFWHGVRTQWAPGWPGSDAAAQWGARQTNFRRWSQEWSNTYPELEPDFVLFRPALVNPEGAVLLPRRWTKYPVPPGWFTELPAPVAAQWRVVQALEASGAPANDVADAWRKLLEGGVPGEARANVELALLRLDGDGPGGRVDRLCQFAENHAAVAAESGLPLSAVSYAMALREAGTNGLNRTLFRGLATQVFAAPSLLTVYFLEQCQILAEDAPADVQTAVLALRAAWEHQERWRTLAAAYHDETGHQIGANRWLEIGFEQWLASWQRGGGVDAPMDGRPLESSNHLAVSFFPRAVVEQVCATALQEISSTGPAYFGWQAELEGQPVGRANLPEAGDLRPALLAAVSGSVAQARVGAAGAGTELGLDPAGTISAPQFTLQVYLANPAAFYARQHQRTLWFGGLIVAAAAVAVIGFVRARRAFLREHQLSELKTNFVSSVSHELRAPIASVRLMAESLERGKVPEAGRQAEYFRWIVQECRRLSALVTNVLDFSRIEQGRKQYEFEPTDLAELVRETVKVMAPHAAERELRVRVQVPELAGPEPNQPLLDGRAVQQALINLMDNAFKHAPKGSEVTVALLFARAEQEAQGSRACWRVSVQDQGSGIVASEHERIFERFYRLGSELRRDTQGVGIGLSIVKHVVEAHRGRVTVESELGQGSCFTMEFPAA